MGVFVPSITMFQETPAAPDKGRLIAMRAGFGQLGAPSGFCWAAGGGRTGDHAGSSIVAGLAAIVSRRVIYVPYRLAGLPRRQDSVGRARWRPGPRGPPRGDGAEAALTGMVARPPQRAGPAAAWVWPPSGGRSKAGRSETGGCAADSNGGPRDATGTPLAGGAGAQAQPRMGGIALGNGLVFVSDDNWAAAVGGPTEASAVASGRKPQLPGGEGPRWPARRVMAPGPPARGRAGARAGSRRAAPPGGRLPGPADGAGPGPFRGDSAGIAPVKSACPRPNSPSRAAGWPWPWRAPSPPPRRCAPWAPRTP